MMRCLVYRQRTAKCYCIKGLLAHFIVMVNHAVNLAHIAAGIATNDESCYQQADCAAQRSPFCEFFHVFFIV